MAINLTYNLSNENTVHIESNVGKGQLFAFKQLGDGTHKNLILIFFVCVYSI